MTEEQLQQLGLSPSQAKAYLLLVLEGKLTPAMLMKKTAESRTNAYMVLDKLVDLGLALKDEQDKKLVYRASSPIGLQKLAERQRERAFNTEQKIKDAMPELVKFYQTYRIQPGVKFLQGKDGLQKVYQQHLQEGGDAVVFRTHADWQYYGEDFMDGYVAQRATKGMTAQLISPYYKGAADNYQRLPDGREFTWVTPEAYSAPVEIMAYGNKVAITSFGEEAVAMIIESPQIAQAVKEIFALAKIGAETTFEKSA